MYVPQPFPPDPNVQCEYHVGLVRQSTEDCRTFKAKVQDLIDHKFVVFEGGCLLVNNNLLPE